MQNLRLRCEGVLKFSQSLEVKKINFTSKNKTTTKQNKKDRFLLP